MRPSETLPPLQLRAHSVDSGNTVGIVSAAPSGPGRLRRSVCMRMVECTTPDDAGDLPSGFLTSLRFCCAGWALTRGRELPGERPRTLI